MKFCYNTNFTLPKQPQRSRCILQDGSRSLGLFWKEKKTLSYNRRNTVFDDNFSYFSSKPYVVTPHLNRLMETVQMRGHNICFNAEITKIIPNYHQILPLIYSSGDNLPKK